MSQQSLDPSEYAARLAFRRDVHQTLEEAHRKLRELHDSEINRIGQKLGMQEAEKKEQQGSQGFVPEQTFQILKFEDAKGEKLGEFQIAYKSSNLPDKWSSAYNILRQNNATIKERYHGPDYEFGYWLYGEDKIFRQKLKPKTT